MYECTYTYVGREDAEVLFNMAGLASSVVVNVKDEVNDDGRHFLSFFFLVVVISYWKILE